MDRDFDLLRTIIDNPDDDAPRLIYADWLEEHGQNDRAEFIRVQIEYSAILRSGTDIPRIFPLRIRQHQLLRLHEKEWVSQISQFVRSWTFERGFAEYVWLEAAEFLAHADALFANTPIRRLNVTEIAGHVPALVQSTYLARLSDLFLAYLNNADVQWLLQSPHLKEPLRLYVHSEWGLSPANRSRLQEHFGDRLILG